MFSPRTARAATDRPCLVGQSALQPFSPAVHLNLADAVPSRCRREEETMEIAAVLMFAAALMGFVQQFDDPSW